ncbi:hypothetical protein PFLUV_G00139900 [Perca fluviatilis]|uniref:PiggyBac transposable element-derived protein domain-containing protein n=1 Tax=Perca fluviatilis TaxID=8168 RepID=A0A6A5F5D3_PERFL|nr:hypothetical protein PFLUV_G00139900 [Perca fluviatilis]
MDTRLFYGSKKQDPPVRQIPSDSEDSEIDSSDSEEEWNGEKDTLDTSENEDEDTYEDDNLSEDDSSSSKTPRWKTCHRTASPVHPEHIPPSADEILSPYQYFKSLLSDDLFELIVNESNLYSIQCNPAKPLNLTVQELEQFFGTVLHMSLFGLVRTSPTKEGSFRG